MVVLRYFILIAFVSIVVRQVGTWPTKYSLFLQVIFLGLGLIMIILNYLTYIRVNTNPQIRKN